MIYKVLSRKSPSYKSLLKYFLKRDEDISKFYKHNIFTNSLEEINNEFKVNESFRDWHRSDQVYFWHEILSFSDKEDMSVIPPEFIQQFTEEYIKQRGINGQYVIAPHFDTEHLHLHILASALEYSTGKSNRMTHAKLLEIKNNLQKFHEHNFKEISHSSCNHGTKQNYPQNGYFQKNLMNKRKELLPKLNAQISEILNTSKTKQQFLNSLTENNLQYYERNGELAGLYSENLKFRFKQFEQLTDKIQSLEDNDLEISKILDEINDLRESRKESIDLDINENEIGIDYERI